MVTRANTRTEGIGGHLSTYASSAALYEVGFNHFFRGKADGGFGDQVFFQGHASPGIYARAYVEGRLTETELDNFRHEVGGDGLPSYPHPRTLPRLLGVPDRVDGARADLGHLPGPHQPVPAPAPPRRHQRQPRLVLRRRRRDGRARVDRRAGRGRARAPRQPDLRRELQPAAARRPGAWQRQDHPGARGRLPRRRLERHQGDLGLALGRAVGQGRRRRPARPHEHDARRRVPEAGRRVRRLHPRALLRPRPPPAQDGRGPERRRAGLAPPRRARLPQALRRLQAGHRAAWRARPSSWPRRSRGGRSGPRSRPATPPTRSRR